MITPHHKSYVVSLPINLYWEYNIEVAKPNSNFGLKAIAYIPSHTLQ